MKISDAVFLKSRREEGFSLVELSVVIVIIGLLVGGIVGGQSLIRSAYLRSTIAQITEITTAVNTFKSQYGGYPGDINNATNYWGASTANGNGDGIISNTAACQMGDALAEPDCGIWDGERAQAFNQLSLAGLLSATYDATGVLGEGYPAVKMHPGQGMIFTGPWVSATASNMHAENFATNDVYLYIGICNAADFPNTDGGHNDCGIFVPEEAFNIDTKLDDGNPTAGKMIGTSTNTTCVGTITSQYYITGTDQACEPMISMSQ